MKPSVGKTFIIAEAGVNHNGDLACAMKLVDAAKTAGADAVKFQTFNVNENYSGLAASNRIGWAEQLALSKGDFIALYEYCKSKNIIFMSTPFDARSAELLSEIGVSAFKVASSELCNYPLLACIAGFSLPVILSVGMGMPDEIDAALSVLQQGQGISSDKITILYCVSLYPAPYHCHRLHMISYLHKKHNVSVGFSDHSLGIELPIAAVALGASMIEKHIKLSPEHRCPDEAVSLDPSSFKAMVDSIRHVELAMNSDVNGLHPSELGSRRTLRKGLYAVSSMNAGDIISECDVEFLKPCVGLGMENYHAMIGKRLLKPVKGGEPLTEAHLDMA